MAVFLIYGASGYTGTLAAEHAVSRGLAPVLAGRSAEKVRAVARRLALPWRCFPLDDPIALREGLDGVSAVLHAAGPFSATSRPMADACLAARIHYVDVTGEINVFEALAARDGEARAAGVALLPGAGFDVVPSDCLAARVAGRLSGAVRLRLAIGGFGGLSSVSRGTAKTMLEAASRGVRVRRGGKLVELGAAPSGSADFGRGPRPTVGVSWGDVSTAWRSTGVPDIDVAFEATPPMRRAASMPGPLRRMIGSPAAQRLLSRLIETRLPQGPTMDQRAGGRSLFLAEAWDESGRYAATRLETPEGYTLTARTAVEITRRAAAGETPNGYQTPATAFGADFILSFEGVQRTDVPGAE